MNYQVIVRDRVAHNIANMTFLAFELGLDGRVISRAADNILLALSDNPNE